MSIDAANPSFTTAEKFAIRAAATQRGMAPIPEALDFVAAHVARIVTTALGRDDPNAREWVDDRIRLFMAIDAGRWFAAADLDDPPLLNELNAPIFDEFVQLVRAPGRFHAGHLIAWFWLLQREVFGPRIDAMLATVTGLLVEGVMDVAARGGNWRAEMADWDSFFRG